MKHKSNKIMGNQRENDFIKGVVVVPVLFCMKKKKGVDVENTSLIN